MKKIWLLAILFLFLAACSDNTNEEENTEENEELASLEVNFDLPESAEAGETVSLKATVTYGDEPVADADEMEFEYWNVEDEENTTMIDSVNNNDGTYTAEVTFNEPGTYEIYAHTQAREMHNMPKKSITITGETVTEADQTHPSHEENEESHHGHTENFSMSFEQVENVRMNEETDLNVSLLLDNQPLKNARVRYEIIRDGEEKHEWVDATEESGTYSATHTFSNPGSYTIVIHVTNDDGLHEHEEHTVEVTE
ncbi:YtkA-like [Gracilibacillus ureilyticus]|uniref:YtkA-like n=1 Tax=Gracilibacillus ureilyticus TaxID=531814 RepID=A0A1H9P6H3_9BACI|nr:FixH family protein [Gracilibacillus ureilyticus]SER43798.1 YtkA-like [Gracilibacillus ureilyticus]